MNRGKIPAGRLKRSPVSSVCVVFILIVTSLSLNFFTKPMACPMKYADGQMDGTFCACCCRNHSMHRDKSQRGRATGMSCRCGMCHITNRGVVSSRAKGGSTIYLKLSNVVCLLQFDARPFRQYKASPALFLLPGEKDRPPEVS